MSPSGSSRLASFESLRAHTESRHFYSSWDEWVPESRVLKFNDENITRQKALILAAQNKGKEKEQEKQAAAAASAAASSSAGGSKDSGGSRKRPRDSDEKGRRGGSAGVTAAGGPKRGRDAVGDEEEFLRRPEIKIVIPDALKVQLVDDWENVTKYDQLVPLPKKPNVKDVLKMYRDHVLEERKKRETKSNKDSKDGASGGGSGSSRLLTQPLAVLDEVLSGLELYFDKALGNNLLYRFERTQYLQISKGAAAAMTGRSRGGASASGEEGKSKREVTPTGGQEAEEKQPSEIYGAEHLLRLFGESRHILKARDSRLLTCSLCSPIPFPSHSQPTLYHRTHDPRRRFGGDPARASGRLPRLYGEREAQALCLQVRGGKPCLPSSELGLSGLRAGRDIEVGLGELIDQGEALGAVVYVLAVRSCTS